MIWHKVSMVQVPFHHVLCDRQEGSTRGRRTRHLKYVIMRQNGLPRAYYPRLFVSQQPLPRSVGKNTYPLLSQHAAVGIWNQERMTRGNITVMIVSPATDHSNRLARTYGASDALRPFSLRYARKFAEKHEGRLRRK